MILNLIGNIATGKSTFAHWLMKRNPDWRLITIDYCREQALRELCGEDILSKSIQRRLVVQAGITKIEKAAWDYAIWECSQRGDVIFESTGDIWRLQDFYRELESSPIYTIRFDADPKVCKERARTRKKLKVYPYDYNEEASIDEWKAAPANLVVDTNQVESYVGLYSTIEEKIAIAKARLDAIEIERLF